MLEDPDINLWAFPHPDASSDRLYSYEICDPCEADALGYTIGNILVSDFVFPAWFESFHLPGSTQFDFQNHAKQPFGILPGGYCLVYDIRNGTGYHQIFGSDEPTQPFQRPRVGSRRERRTLDRSQWRRSQVCGVERWLIKTLSDPQAGQVDLNAAPTPATVSLLRQRVRPGNDISQQLAPDQRVAPEERTVFVVTGVLVGAKVEQDGDVHLVIADENDPSATMIVEFSNPNCVQSTVAQIQSMIGQARTAVLAAGGPTLQRMASGVPTMADLANVSLDAATSGLVPMRGKARITGVGFFDTAHGQAGVAPNAIELHPALSFQVLA